MRHSTFTSVMIFACVLMTANAARAQDAKCGGGFTVRQGQHTQGSLSTRAGVPCKMTYVTFGSSRPSSGIQIATRPRNGSAATDGTGFRYAPKPGFRGADTVTVRYNWNGPPSNKPGSGLVTFLITVD